jgi:DNA-binding FrmR family transcriptional regulator
MTKSPQNPQRHILNRLRRARGQLDAVIAAVERGGSCRDVVTQLAAVSSALDRAGYAIIASAMKDCLVSSPDREGSAEEGEGVRSSSGLRLGEDELTAEELEKLFMMLA